MNCKLQLAIKNLNLRFIPEDNQQNDSDRINVEVQAEALHCGDLLTPDNSRSLSSSGSLVMNGFGYTGRLPVWYQPMQAHKPGKACRVSNVN